MIMFNGEVIFITGAGSGMGRQAAIEFAQEGAAIVAFDLDGQAIKETAALVRENGGKIEAFQLDITNANDVEVAYASAQAALGPVKGLINFAGITQSRCFDEMTLEEWERIIRTNLTGSFISSQAVFRSMMKTGGGCIVNLSSAAIHSGGGHIGTAHYTASKAGIVGLSRAIAKEGAPYGIRSNVICPGLTQTSMTQSFLETGREQSIKGIPAGRIGLPEDIVYASMFLCSSKANYITGVTLNVNGGLVMR